MTASSAQPWAKDSATLTVSSPTPGQTVHGDVRFLRPHRRGQPHRPPNPPTLGQSPAWSTIPPPAMHTSPPAPGWPGPPSPWRGHNRRSRRGPCAVRPAQQRWLRDRSRFDPMPPRPGPVYAHVSGTVISGPDGFFVFPVVESGVYWLRVEKDGYTYAQREVSLVRNQQTTTDAVYLTPLDAALTTCDAAGCAHTNSDGSMQVIVPPGAIAPGDTLDVTATVFDQVEFLPSGGLPPGTWETYAFNLGGDSDYTFQPGTEVTVRIANSRGFAPGTSIPLGYWNPETLAWEHAGQGVVDVTGAWVEMTVTHFSNYDCNDPISVPELETDLADQSDDNDEDEECPEGETGCFVDLRRGTLGESVTLPTVQILGQDVAPTLLYNSDRVVPAAVIDLKFSLDFESNVTLGDSIGFELFVGGIRTQDFTIDADLQPGEVGRFRYLWDGRDAEGTLLPPGLYAYTARFRVPYQGEYCFALNGIFGNPPDCENGATGVFVTGEKRVDIEGTVDLNTQPHSPLGAGWVLAGMQRLYRDDLGRILITDGDRAAEFFDPAQNAIERGLSGLSGSGQMYEPQPAVRNSQFAPRNAPAPPFKDSSPPTPPGIWPAAPT
ncbi:MAG: hypothetical protein R2856_07380 [Caldilineaceae bacterium]